MKITVRGRKVVVDLVPTRGRAEDDETQAEQSVTRPKSSPKLSWRNVAILTVLIASASPVLGAVVYAVATDDTIPLRTLLEQISELLGAVTALLRKLG